jgi:Lon protease-like protein
MGGVKAFMLPALLPLFPLPRTVLFPRTFLPLHIFEPRYREMTRDILGSHHHLLLALAMDPEHQDPLPSTSGFHAVGTLTRVVRAEPLVDGRWNLLVQGVQPVLLSEESKGTSYRQARFEPSAFEAGSPWLHVDRERFFATLEAYGTRFGIGEQISDLAGMNLDEDALIYTLCLALDFEPVEKQFLLESASMSALAQRFEDLMRFSMANRHLPERD